MTYALIFLVCWYPYSALAESKCNKVEIERFTDSFSCDRVKREIEHTMNPRYHYNRFYCEAR